MMGVLWCYRDIIKTKVLATQGGSGGRERDIVC
jgi:hypothetical protein